MGERRTPQSSQSNACGGETTFRRCSTRRRPSAGYAGDASYYSLAPVLVLVGASFHRRDGVQLPIPGVLSLLPGRVPASVTPDSGSESGRRWRLPDCWSMLTAGYLSQPHESISDCWRSSVASWCGADVGIGARHDVRDVLRRFGWCSGWRRTSTTRCRRASSPTSTRRAPATAGVPRSLVPAAAGVCASEFALSRRCRRAGLRLAGPVLRDGRARSRRGVLRVQAHQATAGPLATRGTSQDHALDRRAGRALRAVLGRADVAVIVASASPQFTFAGFNGLAYWLPRTPGSAGGERGPGGGATGVLGLARDRGGSSTEGCSATDGTPSGRTGRPSSSQPSPSWSEEHCWRSSFTMGVLAAGSCR